MVTYEIDPTTTTYRHLCAQISQCFGLQVTWVEHMEAHTSAVHGLYQPFVESGMAFGARRWMCTLQRQCERIASVLANIAPRDMSGERKSCAVKWVLLSYMRIMSCVIL